MQVITIMDRKAVLIETKREILIVVDDDFLGPYPKSEKQKRIREVMKRLSESIH